MDLVELGLGMGRAMDYERQPYHILPSSENSGEVMKEDHWLFLHDCSLCAFSHESRKGLVICEEFKDSMEFIALNQCVKMT